MILVIEANELYRTCIMDKNAEFDHSDRSMKMVRDFLKNSEPEVLKSISTAQFDTWKSLMDVLNNDRKSLKGEIFLKEINN